MTLFAQHGWGKSDKIETALDEEIISGVILSPRDETPVKLRAFIDKLRAEYGDSEVFIDPQYYATTRVDPSIGRLGAYDYFEIEKNYQDFLGARNISRIVESVVDFQSDLAVTKIVSPTVGIESFSDRWRTVSANLAVESVTYWNQNGDDRPMLVGLLLSEAALMATADLDAFLDSITFLDCAGFYIVISRQMNDYRQTFPPQALAGLMYLTYVLAEQNDFEIYFGYTDYCALPLHAAGATATACGWSNSLRRFNFGRFTQSTGGAQPRERYSSRPLLNNVFLSPELDDISRTGHLRRVLTGTSRDRALNTAVPSSVDWPPATAALHHWDSLARTIADIEAQRGIVAKLDHLETVLQSSTDLYTRLRTSQVGLTFPSGPAHLEDWKRATSEFRARIGR